MCPAFIGYLYRIIYPVCPRNDRFWQSIPKLPVIEGIALVDIAISHTPFVWLQKAVILAILAGYASVIMVMLMGPFRVFFSVFR